MLSKGGGAPPPDQTPHGGTSLERGEMGGGGQCHRAAAEKRRGSRTFPLLPASFLHLSPKISLSRSAALGLIDEPRPTGQHKSQWTSPRDPLSAPRQSAPRLRSAGDRRAIPPLCQGGGPLGSGTHLWISIRLLSHSPYARGHEKCFSISISMSCRSSSSSISNNTFSSAIASCTKSSHMYLFWSFVWRPGCAEMHRGTNTMQRHTHTHTHTHTDELQTNRRAAQRRVRMSIPRQLVIKQDKACSTPVGAFLRGQARSSDLILRRKKDGAALWQYRREVTTTSPGYHPPFQVLTEQGRYAPCDVYVLFPPPRGQISLPLPLPLRPFEDCDNASSTDIQKCRERHH